jgi:glycosyltransferase involved in cell wall biosynthesis
MTTAAQYAQSVQVSLVLPAYNEVDYLAPAVEKTMQTLNEFAPSYEIIIAEDGSTDGTAERAQELAQKYPCVKHIHRDTRLGRGTALNNAFRQSHGEVLVYMDLDLATDLKYLKPLVESISVEGYDFATGSRMLPESTAERTFSRGLSSKTYNFLVRHMLGSKRSGGSRFWGCYVRWRLRIGFGIPKSW